MSADPNIAHDQTVTPAPVPGEPDSEVAAAWHDRELAIVSELAEAGLEIALALKTRIAETAAPDPNPASAAEYADLTRAFDRASRAMRMAIALRRRVLKDAAAGVQGPEAAAQEARACRAGRVRRIVNRVARYHYSNTDALPALGRLTSEQLDDPDISGDLEGHPIGALVAQICKDLGLSPSWLDLAQEAWARAEIAERPPGSPYAAWPDLPPPDPDLEEPDPDDPDLWDDDDPADDDEPCDPGGSDP